MEMPNDRLQNPKIFVVEVHTEIGCDISKGEYASFLTQMIGSLELSGRDHDLVRDAIDEAVRGDKPQVKMPEEGVTEIRLIERCEREDVFLNQYFEVLSSMVIFHNE